WLSDETIVGDEGCLSFPGIYVSIKRSLRAKVRAIGLDGQVFEMERDGLCARAFQHETDHLNGRLMVDFVGPLKSEMIKSKMKRVASGEDPGDGDEADGASANQAR